MKKQNLKIVKYDVWDTWCLYDGDNMRMYKIDKIIAKINGKKLDCYFTSIKDYLYFSECKIVKKHDKGLVDVEVWFD